ncbi:MAG: hypothetical protein H6822_26040 [Planctomycetaceae bacterium]|nr:hypothetical protein [Planctomycetales bacterium]MCB9925638.1 hypothetical protein [Planctomycetaceae bacterium]
MEILDNQIREELLARLERDPNSIALYKTPAPKGCMTVVAIAAAFGCGFALAAILYM